MNKLKKQKKGAKVIFKPGNYSFVIGNGTSRKDADLTQIRDYGYVLACNYFFRDEFMPDMLVTSDEPITTMFYKVNKDLSRRTNFYTWSPKPGSGAKKVPSPEKFSAGGLATQCACEVVQSNKVFLIGMDFFGFGSTGSNDNGRLNNLYAGKKHYQSQTEADVAPTYRNWQRRFQWIMCRYPHIDFYHVNPFEGKSPERLRGLKNFHQITWENLLDHVRNDAPLVDVLEKTEEDIKVSYEQNPDNLRAAIERQIVGQENVVFSDLLSPEQILNLRLLAAKEARKGNFNPAIQLAGEVFSLGFYRPDAPVPKDSQITALFDIETRNRYKLMTEGMKVWGRPHALKIPKLPEQQVPTPSFGDLGTLPPPPPPPMV